MVHQGLARGHENQFGRSPPRVVQIALRAHFNSMKRQRDLISPFCAWTSYNAARIMLFVVAEAEREHHEF
jgi:hypothetical protein